MKKKRYFTVAVFFITSIIYSQNATYFIKTGDSLAYIEFNYTKALENYYSALELTPNNTALLNKISKTIVLQSDYLFSSLKNVEEELKFGEKSKEESLDSAEIKGAQLENYKKALEVAEKTIQLEPNNAEAYVRRAVANARIAVTKGIFSVASIVNKVKEDLEFAIKLGTGGKDVQAFAHYILAKTHDEVSEKWAPARKIIGLGWGNIERALEEYKKAIDIKNDVIMFYLDYAKALLEEDEEDKAKEMLRMVDSCKIIEREDERRILEAKQLLSSLE